MNAAFAASRITLLVVLVWTAGCLRQKTVQDFGLPHPVTNRTPLSPDASVRATFKQQTNGAFNPVVDDSRIPALQARLNGNPTDAVGHLELAALYEGYRLYSQALEEYTRSFDLARTEKAVLGIARCDQALNLAWRAIPLLEQFLQSSPSAPAWNALGLLHDDSADLPAGEKALRAAVAADWSSDQWHNNLGYNLMRQDKLEEAEAEFRLSLERSPKSITAHNNLGILLARRGNLEGALEQFLFGADAATAHNNLAVVLMEAGKYEQSREQLVKALGMRRNFAPALSNFKLVQERIRQRAELEKAGRSTPSKVRLASAGQETSPPEREEQ
jgi:tetratricopeptide (TPR) repeat protein